MKKGLLLLLLINVVVASAQKRFSEGTIQYAVTTVVGGDTISTDLRYTEIIKGGHYRSDLFSPLASSTTFFDSREDTGAIVKMIGTQKILTRISRANWNEINAKYINSTYQLTDQCKEVLGYTCTLAKTTLKDGTRMEVYFSPEIRTDNPDLSIRFSQLPGLALEYTARKGNKSVTYRVVSIGFDPVPIQQFDVPASGFRVLGFEESKRLQ
jgi:GLPGLI family protein